MFLPKSLMYLSPSNRSSEDKSILHRYNVSTLYYRYNLSVHLCELYSDSFWDTVDVNFNTCSSVCISKSSYEWHRVQAWAQLVLHKGVESLKQVQEVKGITHESDWDSKQTLAGHKALWADRTYRRCNFYEDFWLWCIKKAQSFGLIKQTFSINFIVPT